MREGRQEHEAREPVAGKETEALRKAAQARKRAQDLIERAEELRAITHKLHRRAENLRDSAGRAHHGPGSKSKMP